MTSTPYATQAEFDAAVTVAHTAASNYYHSATLTHTDADYDALIDAITASVAAHPDWDARGLLDTVAAGTPTGGTVTHPTPMLSMDKTTNPTDMAAFVTRVASPVAVEMKMDGLSLRATYTDGQLVALTTRGDGTVGEAVSLDMDITGLPRTIALPGTWDVRGEAFMTDIDFERSNINRVAAGKTPFANSRNGVAGTIRRDTVTYDAYLSFAAYDADNAHADNDYTARMAALAAAGFDTVLARTAAAGIDTTPTTNPADVLARITAIGQARATLPYGIDGAVVKATSTTVRAAIGSGSRAPKWAFAYKYAAVEASSVLRDIAITVGKTGRMGLTAIIDPVDVDGATVSKATLHNPAFIADQGLGRGSRVIVVRRGDVIPYVTAALDGGNDGVTPWTPPAVHDVCGQPWNSSEIVWRCDSPECSQVGKVVYYASRDVMDIDGLGTEIATALVESGLVTTVADLYELTVDQIAAVPVGVTTTGKPKLIGSTVATKLAAGIEQSKTQPLNRVVTGLSIRKMGRTMGRRVASHFGTLDAIRAATAADFENVEGVASEKARYYVEGFAANAATLDRLIAAGITTSIEPAAPVSTGSVDLTGHVYVVSGSVPGYTRTSINERIEELGGKASSSVTAKTTALVTAETATSKAKKAAELGVTVLDPTEFAAYIN